MAVTSYQESQERQNQQREYHPMLFDKWWLIFCLFNDVFWGFDVHETCSLKKKTALYHLLKEILFVLWFSGMEHRLIKMMRFTLWGTLISAVLLVYSIAQTHWFVYLQQGWMVVKLALVTVLIIYHYWCIKIHHNFIADSEQRSHVWFRVFNEVPALLLLVVIYLVIAKPFWMTVLI